MTEAISNIVGQAVAPLEASRPLHADPASLCRALAHPEWLGQLIAGPDERPDLRRVHTDLAFMVGADRRILTFRKAALVDIGLVPLGAHECAGEIAWRAASFAPLFPVFAGRLVVRADTLHLDGVYAPPGGGVGLLVDRAILHYFAQRTAGWFLDRLAAELERLTTS